MKANSEKIKAKSVTAHKIYLDIYRNLIGHILGRVENKIEKNVRHGIILQLERDIDDRLRDNLYGEIEYKTICALADERENNKI